MHRIWKLPETEESTQQRPARCPRCGGKRIYRHSQLRRRVIDPKVQAVPVLRFRCEDCRKLVRVHPVGVVPQQQQSRRLQVLSALCYALGLSYDKASQLLERLGCGVVKSTIWRNVQALGEAVGKAWHPQGRCPVLGADETQLKIKGQGITVGFVTDPRSGQVVALEVLASREAAEVERWRGGLLSHFGCEVVVTDELES
jgi:DNA-directed RNA polymerase subunit RPC12/RpoP